MRIVTDAVLALLKTNSASLDIGDGVAPADTTYPYAVLYPLDETDRDGDYRQIDRTGWWEYQITAVGETRMQAEAAADLLRDLLYGSSPVVAGFGVGPWRMVTSVPVERDDDPQNTEFYASHTLECFIAPA